MMLRRVFSRLRAEEGLLVIAFIASAILTVYANVDLYNRHISSRRIRGGLVRIAVVPLIAAWIPVLGRTLRRRDVSPRWLATADFLRTMLPFFMCIAVYVNLHDTVRYVNTHDIQQYIAAAEEWLFGGQPVLWAERYITPARTEFFNLFYANFYLVAPSVVLILWFGGKRAEARDVLLRVIVCFYTGYFLYIIFPAAPPRLYYEWAGAFTVSLRGGPITHFQNALIDLVPNHAERAAFPSLHSAVSVLSLYYAWKYCRWFFPVLLPFVMALLVATVYLRHHWVVDLLAGLLLVPWSIWLAPRFDRFWETHVRQMNGFPDLRTEHSSALESGPAIVPTAGRDDKSM
jgi:membrane-associated phospholipid phosphatase